MQLSRRGAQVVLVDPRPPLTATSQYSTECYRDFFTDAALVPFMSRSIDILEELAGEDNGIHLGRRGYAFLTGSAGGAERLEAFAEAAASAGAGSVRRHHQDAKSYVHSPSKGFQDPALKGFDLVYGSDAIQAIYPFVTGEAQVMLHARRCGWMDSQGMGQAMLAEAKEGRHGGSARVLKGSIAGFDLASGGDVARVRVCLPDGSELALDCDAFVNAAGAWMQRIQSMLAPGEELPVTNDIHAKVILDDHLGVVPQDLAPFMVWSDKVNLDWDEETREGLTEMDDTAEGGIINSARWLQLQPGGQHLRPAGNGRVLMLWEHLHRHIEVPEVPEMPVGSFLDMYPELCVAGLQRMVPGLSQYEGVVGRGTTIDGGYYTESPDGRPIVGRHGAGNAFVCGGMGTYGLMGAPAAGELAALHALGEELPGYAVVCEWPRKEPLLERPVDLLDDPG